MSQDEFWKHVDVKEPDNCWPWIGNRHPKGYGQLCRRGKTLKAHRMAYMLTYGPIEVGKHVCHTCDNPPCCNPGHLWLGTNRQNRLDAAKKGRLAKKYTVEDIELIRSLIFQGVGTCEIARRLNRDPSTISKIKTGKIWKSA